MVEQVTIEDYQKKKAELLALEAQLKAEGVEMFDPSTGKPLWKSKMFWVNVVAIGVLVVNQVFGITLSEEEVAILLGTVFPVINIILRYRASDITGVAK